MRQQTIFSMQPSKAMRKKKSEATELFRYQRAAVKKLCGKRLAILTAPVASGKSVMVKYIGIDTLTRHPKMKLVMLVPERSNAGNFTETERIKNGKSVTWECGHDLTDGKDTTARFIKFLTDPPGNGLKSRSLVACTPTGVRAFRQLAAEGKLDAFRNTCTWFDEAHHIVNAMIEGSNEIQANQQGELLRHLVSVRSFVGMTTATYFRSDELHILDDKLYSKFTPHNCDPAKVNLENPYPAFQYDILFGDPYKAVKRLFRHDRKSPTILWIPIRNSLHAEECKYAEVQKYRDAIPAGLSVLDIVTEATATENLEILEKVRRGEEHRDVIIALERGKEGINFPALSRGIIVGARHSINEMCQTLGRILRPSKGKQAHCYQILPTPVNTAVLKEDKNRGVTAIFAGMTLAEFFAPVEKVVGEGGGTRGKYRRLIDVLPANRLYALWPDFVIAARQGDNESLKSRSRVLKAHGVAKKDHAWVWKALLRRANHDPDYAKKVPSLDILKDGAFKNILNLTTGLLGPIDPEELRDRIAGDWHSDAEMVSIAEELVNRFGWIPVSSWLNKHGYGWLCKRMCLKPELFRQFKHEPPKRRSDAEAVGEAEKLVKRFGWIPVFSWLMRNGYGRLADRLRKSPDKFKQFKREPSQFKSDEDAIAEAEKLVKRFGWIRVVSWLESHNRNWLVSRMRAKPDLFKKFKREPSKRRSDKQAVAEARALVKRFGWIPSPGWLQKNNHRWLDQRIRNQPALFAGLKRQPKGNRTQAS